MRREHILVQTGPVIIYLCYGVVQEVDFIFVARGKHYGIYLFRRSVHKADRRVREFVNIRSDLHGSHHDPERKLVVNCGVCLKTPETEKSDQLSFMYLSKFSIIDLFYVPLLKYNFIIKGLTTI